MTTTQLQRFNRNVDILFRYNRGDVVESIAKIHGLKRLQVFRIVCCPSDKLRDAAADRLIAYERRMGQ